MASPHTQSNPATSPSPLSFSTDSHRHGRSKTGKAQMCLLKILRIISLFPAVDVSYKQRLSHDDSDGSYGKKEFDVDLNIGLGVSKEIEPLEYPVVATDGLGEDCVFMKNDRRKIDLFFEEKQETVEDEDEEERATEQSEISHVGDQSSGIDCNGFSEEVEEKIRDEGYLDLLIEAAQLILGDECEPPGNKTEMLRNNDVESSPPPPLPAEKGGAKRKKHCWTTATAAAEEEEEEWYVEFEDTSPVVKSKRGRNQVLPFKYRDSVLEPLVRRPSSSRHRSITGGAFPSKRRSK